MNTRDRGGLAALGKLTALTTLDLSNNYFSGSIPASIGNLPSLRIFAFCDNEFTGAVPFSLRSGVSLVNYPTSLGYDTVQCQRSSARRTNTITSSSSTTTTTTPRPTATVRGAQGCFDGTYVPLSVDIQTGANNDLADDCQNLIALQNYYGGVTNGWGSSDRQNITRWRGVIINNERVTALHLSSTGLSGTLRADFGNLTALTDLRLDSNSLTGRIPSQWRSLSNLRRLDVDLNRLSGSLPSWLGSLSNLRVLELDGNSFAGSIPREIGNLSNLTWLDVSENRLSGNIPTQLNNLAPSQGGSLTRLDICNNDLTGALPQHLRASSINLVRYSRSGGYENVQCQRTTPATSSTTTTTPGSTTTTTPGSTTTTTTTPGSTTTTTTTPGSTTTTTTTTAPASTTTTTTAAPTSACSSSQREWPALLVDSGGASIAAIRTALFDSTNTRAIFRWNQSTGAWVRVSAVSGTLPQGAVISLRCVTTNANTLANLNLLTGTQQIALRQNTNLVIAPEDLTRPEGARSAYFIADELTSCGGVSPGNLFGGQPGTIGPSSGITTITIRSATTGRWSISMPCNPELEDTFIARPENNYDEVSSINQGDIIYLRFITSTSFTSNYDIYWNSETNQYEAGTGFTIVIS